MGKLGTSELILILLVAMAVFGPSKLPELGRLAGSAIGSLKRQVNQMESEWEDTEEPEKQSTKVMSAESAETNVTGAEAGTVDI